MFEQAGFNQGEKDGMQDAIDGKRYRPKPDLTRSVLSSGFRQGYMAGYDKAYYHTKQALIREALRQEQLAEKAEQTLSQNSGVRGAFDKGWEDGFKGNSASTITFIDGSDVAAYKRGYKLGARDRDFTRAKALREQMTLGNDDRKSQFDWGREV